MVNEVKVVLNDAGIQELLKSAGVKAFLGAKGQLVEATAQAASGGEHITEIIEGKVRARVVVRTADLEARKAESERQTLSRAGHSVGGSPGRGG